MAASSAALSLTASDVLERDKAPRFLTQLSRGGQNCCLGSYRPRQIPETAELQPVACLHDLTDRTVEIGEPRFPVFAMSSVLNVLSPVLIGVWNCRSMILREDGRNEPIWEPVGQESANGAFRMQERWLCWTRHASARKALAHHETVHGRLQYICR